MKNRNRLYTLILTFSLCASIGTLFSCGSDDDADVCSNFECVNGGEKIAGVDGCRCDCPIGYTGLNCQTKSPECPVTVECPIGKTPNPDNGCKCE